MSKCPFPWRSVIYLLSLPCVFWLGMRHERSSSPACPEDPNPTVQVQQWALADSRLHELERTVESLDETLAVERSRLDETRQRVQAHREDAIRCCEARSVR